MQTGPAISRRSALVAVGMTTAAAAGCSGSGGTRPAGSGSTRPSAAATDALAAVDADLRRRAVAAERRLLDACAGPAVLEPFATLRRLHADHLQTLTGHAPLEPATRGHAPPARPLAAAERTAAAARRTDCVRASPALAPLLASLAASGDVAVALLAP